MVILFSFFVSRDNATEWVLDVVPPLRRRHKGTASRRALLRDNRKATTARVACILFLFFFVFWAFSIPYGCVLPFPWTHLRNGTGRGP
jgi:hypothetical protein